MRKILICGATSSIALHTARLFAAQGDAFCLAARNPEKLTAAAADLRVRGASQVETHVIDLADTTQHARLWGHAKEVLGNIDTVLIAQGVLPDQEACEREYSEAAASFQLNLMSAVSLLTLIANDFEARRSGCIAVISSVAGERGRQSIYVYAAAKAGLSTFLQGLRNRLYASGVTVITIKPGYIKTPMTANLPPSKLTASPETAARCIYNAIKNKKDVVYVPGFWRWIMWVIRSIPEPIFKRTNL